MRSIADVGIVGASAAGISAAFELRRAGFEGRVTVFDADNRTPYERPPLSKALGRGLDELVVSIAPAETYRDYAIDLALGTPVTSIDKVSQRVAAGGEWLRFDRLLLATGARARSLDSPTPAANVFTLRSADDAVAIAERLVAGARVVVIGGGFIGLEVAAAAVAIGAQVVVVEATPQPCSGSLGVVVGSQLASLHQSRGVDVRLSATVDRFAGSGTVDRIVLAGGETLEADVVVVGVGAAPNVELAVAAELDVDDGILVDETTATNSPWVFAAGDVAAQRPRRHHRTGGRIGHWDNARAQGAVAARSMLGLPAEHVDVPFFWSEQYGLTFQMFGRPVPSDELVFVKSAQAGSFRAFWLRNLRLVAAAALAEGPVLAGARAVIELNLPVDPRQLADEGTSLREVARAARRATSPRPAATRDTSMLYRRSESQPGSNT